MKTPTQKIPVAFAAPAQQILYSQYGDPRSNGWEARWLKLWQIKEQFPWFPQAEIYLHQDFHKALVPAFKTLEAKKLHQEIKTFDGCFNIRHVRGGYSVLSVHSWGAAIDLNARNNPIGTAGKWSADFINTMTECGVYCGQSWNGRKEPMHFALVNG